MPLRFQLRLPRIARRLRHRLAGAHRNDVPFLVAMDVAQAPADIDIQPFGGLLLAHTSVSGKDTKVLTYWKSREHFERDGAAFAGTIGATATGWNGYVRDYHEARERWFKRVPWYTLLATFFAILGAYDNGRLQLNRLVAQPEVHLSMDRQGDFNYFVNDPIDERVFISNYVPVEQRIRVTGSSDVYKGNRPLDLLKVESTGIRELKETDTTHVRLLGRIATPGRYTMKLSVAAKAGYFPDEQVFDISRPITVWQRLPRLDALRIDSVQDDTAFVVATILVGEPASKGLNVSLRLPRHPDVTDVLTSYAGASASERWMRIGEPGQEMGVRMFRTNAPIPGFRQVRMQFAMVGSPSTPWREVVQDLAVYVAANN
jgi:hypothetical protein